MESSLNLESFSAGWLAPSNRQIMIAGPCSAESEEQLLQTAAALSSSYVNLFRAGIWKPRTRPGAFQGLGSKALPWLIKVKEKFGIPVTTEVANEKHVYEALKYGIDVLWIGARTTANPFAVEEIARALKGKNIPVMVKNPVNPDLKLWIGALERLNNEGITRLAAIHRGFSIFGNSEYRNPPQWEIPLKLKEMFPSLPVISDPSHISGNRNFIKPLMKKAMEFSFDGMMVEVHPEPGKAWSDAAQQLTPGDYLANLEKTGWSYSGEAGWSLDLLRHEIDMLDDEILQLFSRRMKISGQIGSYKMQKKLSIFQKNRWRQLLEERIRAGEKKGLTKEFIMRIFDSLHHESVNRQKILTNDCSEEMLQKH